MVGAAASSSKLVLFERESRGNGDRDYQDEVQTTSVFTVKQARMAILLLLLLLISMRDPVVNREIIHESKILTMTLDT
jgi:hypothetical protein